MKFAFVLVLLIARHARSASDTLLQGQVIIASQDYLVSADDTFKLGFFSLGDTRLWYLGIAYNKPSDDRSVVSEFNDQTVVRGSRKRTGLLPSSRTAYGKAYDDRLWSTSYDIVWIANRDIPIQNDSGLLTIDEYGRLKILIPGGNPIMLTSVETTRNVSVTLLDSGNLVLKEVNGGRVLWQSFDYPTNTLLPGMKLGINFETGHTWSLTSWINPNLPASGSYTLGLDPSGSTTQLMIRWEGEIIWRSGVWKEDHFEHAPKLSYNSNYSFHFVTEGNQSYFTYSVGKKYTFPRYQMSFYGFVYETENLAPFGVCASSLRYDIEHKSMFRSRPESSLGCADTYVERPSCRNYDYYFRTRRGFIYGHRFKYKNQNLSIYDCSNLCFKNCSCVAFAYINDDQTGCEIWNEDMDFRETASRRDDSSTRLAFFFERVLLPPEDQRPRKSSLWRWISIGTSILLLLLVLCFVIFSLGKRFGLGALGMLILRTLGNLIAMWSIMAYQRMKSTIENANSIRQPGRGSLRNDLEDVRNLAPRRNRGAMNSHLLHFFKFSSIASATDNFSPANKLGEGGFGSVYKGKLLDGTEVAIKRLAGNSVQGTVEFKNELILIAKLQHTNLVRLVGCCIHRDEKMLIYEYMPNKSLDYFIFGRGI